MSAAVPPGYKQTEVGILPKDWEILPMREIGECLIGLTYSPSNVREYGKLVLRSSNIQNNKLAYDDNVFVEMDIPSRAITQKDDILICVRNGSRALIGKCALIDEKAAGSAFGAFMSVYRSKASKFIFYQFQADLLKRQINGVLGATINQITNKDMNAFLVALPPTALEQQAIAEALSDADALIEGLEVLIAKKRQLRQGTIQKLLKPSDDWLEEQLGDVCMPSKERFSPAASTNEKRCVELEHISPETGSLLGFTSTLDLKSQKAVFRKGDVLFEKLRPYLRKYWFAAFDGVCSTEIWVLKAAPNVSSGWLYWLMLDLARV